MLTKLIPVLLAAAGLSGGLGAGIMLRPTGAEGPQAAAEAHAADQGGGYGGDHGGGEAAFVRLNQQFVVPVLDQGRVSSLVALSLTLNVVPGSADTALEAEPLLRDRFLRVLLDHANSGGFDGAFTSNGAMDKLKALLIEAGNATLGDVVRDVLVLSISRQDV